MNFASIRDYINENFDDFVLMMADLFQIIAIIICWVKLPVWAAGSIMTMWYGIWLMISHILAQNKKKIEMLDQLLRK